MTKLLMMMIREGLGEPQHGVLHGRSSPVASKAAPNRHAPAPAAPHRPVPANLVGKCFNCLCTDHVVVV
jgi:hypothetical protein